MASTHDPYTFKLHSSFAQLLALIRRGHYEDVIELIRSQPTILKLRDRMGRSALHHCADSMSISASNRPNVIDSIELLLHTMPSMVEWQDNEGNIALHLAVMNGNLPIVRRLLRAMSPGQINIADHELHTAIHWSVVSGQLDAMVMALDYGANPSTPDIYGAHPLHYATQNLFESATGGVAVPIQRSSRNLRAEPIETNISTVAKYGTISKRQVNSLRILHHLIKRPQIDVDCIDNELRTPLIWSASSGNHDALLVLVKAGAEISQQDKDGLSALHCSSSRGHYHCVQILITMCGADVHQLDSSGCTPLFYAVALGHPDCVRLLIDAGAQLDHQDHKGRTAAHCGASKGQLEILKILCEHGANLWLKNARGDLPLHDAVKSGRVDLVKWLLDQSPESVNEINLYGRSPIHISAFNHNLEMCRLLVNYGADMNPVMKVRSQYLTPLDAALQNESPNDELIDYLKKHGAQPIAQIDRRLAEYIHRSDQQNTNFMEIDSEESNLTKKISGVEQQGVILDGNISTIKVKSKSRSKNVKIPEFSNEVKQRRSKSTGFKMYDESKNANMTKLPNLVQQTNGYDIKHRVVSTPSSKSVSSSSISPPNSVVHSARHQQHHNHITDKIKNVREFETILDGNNETKHGTHLKQAIITNVYLTTPTTLAPIETKPGTSEATIATAGTALLPIYYVKNVTPLKKLHSSSIVGQKRTKKLSGKTKKSRGSFSVVLEAHDTFESASGDFQKQGTLVHKELTLNKKSKTKYESKDDAKKIEKENDVEVKKQNVINEEDYLDNLRFQKMNELGEQEEIMQERTVDSNIDTEIIQRKDMAMTSKIEDIEKSFEKSKDSFKTDIESSIHSLKKNEKKIDSSSSSAESENEDQKTYTSSSSSSEDEKEQKDSNWLNSKLEIMTESTKEIINGTVDIVKETLQIEKSDSEENETIKKELFQRDFVHSFDNENEYQEEERKKRSIELEHVVENSLEKQKSIENFSTSVEEQMKPSEEPSKDKQTINEIEEKSVLILMIEEQPQQQDHEEPSIVEVFDNEDKTSEIDDLGEKNQLEEPNEKLNQIDNIEGSHQQLPILSKVDELIEREIKVQSQGDHDGDSKSNYYDEIIEGVTDSITCKLGQGEKQGTVESSINTVQSSFYNGINELKFENELLDKGDEKFKTEDSVLNLETPTIKDNFELDIKGSKKRFEESVPGSGEDEEKEEPEQLVTPLQSIRRVSYTKQPSLLMEDSVQTDFCKDERKEMLKRQENGDINLKENLKDSSSIFVSSFGPIRQLKGKKKSYNHIRPKVDSYWSEEYQHHFRQHETESSPSLIGKHPRFKRDKHNNYLASTSQDNYARIDSKIINQTMEKYLRKYYLERKLFEELYDLKRYQIRTGKTNEPQSVSRLVDKFRREIRAPGMRDFKGPYTYRAYEMYLYDLLRQLSRSNQKKIAYLTKSISYEDIASSFERMQAETVAPTSDKYNSRRHRRDHSEGGYRYHSDVPSGTSQMNSHNHYDDERQSATTRHHQTNNKFDPLFDYERQPFGLVINYKYEYHKSQHRTSGGNDGELVDVICENLYKRTGMHGSKMDEMAVSRKIVEKLGNEDNNDNEQETKKNKRHIDTPNKNGNDGVEKVWLHHNDRNDQSYSRCYVYGHRGPSMTENSPIIKSKIESKKQPIGKKSTIPKRFKISINVPVNEIKQRWNRIKQQGRQILREQKQHNFPSILDSEIILWFELNQKWRPKVKILEPY